jgi:FAD/FMN-containing dehydrogenase/Fe-S oxidoreductase
MPQNPQSPLENLLHDLHKSQIEVRTDLPTRLLYSTDASIYQIEPLGVVFPRSLDDLHASVELAAQHRVPILARGSGSSLAGQAIGAALILDTSRHLNHIIDINPETQTATVEPGVILNALNRVAAKHQLQFGPDPASAERATMGGSIANNATGAHSILYGMAADHLLSVDILLGDGSSATLEEVSLQEARRRASENDSAGARLYRAGLEIRERYEGIIREKWPRPWRRASGYNLNYLIPWAPSAPPEWWSGLTYPPVSDGNINLAPLMAGSEGTLGVIYRATVRLVPLPQMSILGVLAFPDVAEACEAAPAILERHPSAIELIPQSLIRLARSVPAYAAQLSFVDQISPGGDPPALLAVEFFGDDPARLRSQVQSLRGFGELYPVLVAETAADQKQVWNIRKVGLGILASRPGDVKSVPVIEDIAVPVENLGLFVREMERLLATYGTQGDFYAHASAGCLHIRPLLNIKSQQGIATLREIATEAVEITLRLGGVISGEHGDGLARSEWIPRLFGEEISSAFRQLKNAADPYGILNPGKILDAQPLDANLRYGSEYRATAWNTGIDFSRQGGLVGAIEMCNGAGVCRKAEGVMCPSFQATQDEMHSTRGRSNLLRAMITSRFPTTDLAEKTVYEALDLCLACKGCKSECPSAVDVAKLRYEFLNHYYQHHRRKIRDYLFARIDAFATLGHFTLPIANLILGSSQMQKLAERWLGLSSKRPLPLLNRHSLREMISADEKLRLSVDNTPPSENAIGSCLFLSDAFTEYYYPETGLAALKVLVAAGYYPKVLPVLGAGRTMISKGFLDEARRRALQVLKSIDRLDPEGRVPVVGVEPSEVYTLHDEYLDLLPNDERANRLADRAFMIDEFLVRPGQDGQPRLRSISAKTLADAPRVMLHGHCYQKAQPPAADGYPVGVGATLTMLEAFGYKTSLVDSSCCGMAGAFGYEAEHFDLSMQVGEMSLFPALRNTQKISGGKAILAASGVSCQAQIEDGVNQKPLHPIELVSRLLTQP